jgi:hypothetical protein
MTGILMKAQKEKACTVDPRMADTCPWDDQGHGGTLHGKHADTVRDDPFHPSTF